MEKLLPCHIFCHKSFLHTKISGKEYYDKRYLINRLPQNTHPEVMEETGLSIRNIIYFDNQPWPYPSGLMMGFVADYAGGEIKWIT
jgi:NAD+ diphosphatase